MLQRSSDDTKRLRKKYGITNKIIFEENEKGIIIKPVFSKREFGSLKGAIKGKTARELLERHGKKSLRKIRSINVLNLLTFDLKPILAFFLGKLGGDQVIDILQKIEKW